jgi:hypothetical protein
MNSFVLIERQSSCLCFKKKDSAVWEDLLKVKEIYLQGRKMLAKNGKTTLFWKDSWLYEKPLYILYPDLFKFCLHPDISVFQVKADAGCVSFTRLLADEMIIDWNKILNDMSKYDFTPDDDVVLWKFGKSWQI